MGLPGRIATAAVRCRTASSGRGKISLALADDGGVDLG